MLFHSPTFLFLFFPTVLILYLILGRFGRLHAALGALTVASWVFYAAWNPAYLPLLAGSIVWNYAISRRLGPEAPRARLVVGIVGNVLLLAVFKYANFSVGTWNALTGAELPLPNIALPLAISFFTFQQIAYLVDRRKGVATDHGFAQYLLFVSFFPQLVAGPIVHHREMMPQFTRTAARVPGHLLALGFTWFTIGLFKKLVVADSVKEWVDPFFAAISRGGTPSFIEAWGGVIGYTVQIYFDFSGYSDMAIGAALMLGIRLPLNFNSPYKATSVADYWRRWHMTLGRWLKEYLYIPLGGSRCSRTRQYTNLMLVLLIAGLWHGAGWNFILWGGIHGVFLCVNHAWRTGWGSRLPRARALTLGYMLLTLGCVAVARVFFRCPDIASALATLQAMAGQHGLSLPQALAHSPFGSLAAAGIRFDGLGGMAGTALPVIFGCLIVTQWAPNSQEILGQVDTTPGTPPRPWQWQLNRRWAVFTAVLFAVSMMHVGTITEFIYYRF